MDNDVVKIEQKNKMLKSYEFRIFGIVIVFLITFFYYLAVPTNDKDTIIHISSGQSVNNISEELKDKNIIKSDFIFKTFIKLFSNGDGIISGDYLIKMNSPVWVVSWQLSRGRHNIDPIKITIREGLDNKEIDDLLFNKIPSFDKDLFLSKIKDRQGYLFPDTYFLYPLDTIDEIIKKMSDNFEKRTKGIEVSRDIIIMASILEGEANGKEDIGMISGILWKRLSIGMPLQVDVDQSTYTRKGLPVEPLNNPGLLSINGAVNPINSPYLYYIHDKNGKVHYGRDFNEHKSNINKYLK